MNRDRDQLGRPVDAGSGEAVPGVIERDDIDSSAAWAEAWDYLERGLPFHAHETFEMRWRCCPDDERDLWRALARWSAALTHLARGNTEGASSIARATIAELLQADHSPLTQEQIDEVLASLTLLERS